MSRSWGTVRGWSPTPWRERASTAEEVAVVGEDELEEDEGGRGGWVDWSSSARFREPGRGWSGGPVPVAAEGGDFDGGKGGF